MTNSPPLFTGRQLFALIWPLTVEHLLNILVGMVDVVMVAYLGEAAVSGVSLVDSLNQLLIQFLAALTAGGTVVCAQFIGMQDWKRAGKSAGQLVLMTVTGMLVICLGFLAGGRQLLDLVYGQAEADVMENAFIYYRITVCSFPFLALYNACASLFRAAGNSRISMKTSLLMNGMNVAGNALCIYGLKLGVAGVAVPTLIARGSCSLLLLSLLQRSDTGLRIPRLRELRPDFGIIRRILGIGIPGGVESGVFELGKLMLHSLVSTLGTTAIAGYAVAGNLVTFLYLPGQALGLALTTVIGRCVGAGEADQAAEYMKKFLWMNYALLAVIASVLGIWRYTWIGLYNLSEASAAVAAMLVLTHCAAMVIWPPAFLSPYALRAAGDAKFTMYLSISCMWFFRVALAYLFVRGMGLSVQFVWVAMYIDWVFRVIAYVFRLRGFADRIRALAKVL